MLEQKITETKKNVLRESTVISILKTHGLQLLLANTYTQTINLIKKLSYQTLKANFEPHQYKINIYYLQIASL